MMLSSLCEAVFNSETDYAILALDADGRLVKWNAGAARMLLLSDASMGAHCTVLDPLPAVEDHPSNEEIEAALRSGKATFDRCHRLLADPGFAPAGFKKRSEPTAGVAG